MSEIFTEHEVQVNKSQDINGNQDSLTEDNIRSTDECVKVSVASKREFTKKRIIILGVALIAVIAIAVALIISHGSEFKRVKIEALQIAGAGMVSDGKDYFTLDTYPDDYENMDELLVAVLLPNTTKKTLEAIKYVNEALGFNDSLYSKMLKTSALMGRQSEENSKYKVSWTYHPDHGLEVTYEKK